MTAILLTFVGIFFLGVLTVFGVILFNEKTIVVPNDFVTIQQAVDEANTGDIIIR